MVHTAWIAIHIGLIRRRTANVSLANNRYWVWTGLHIAWTGLNLVAFLLGLPFLFMLCMRVSQGHNPELVGTFLGFSTASIFSALALAGWVILTIARPPAEAESAEEEEEELTAGTRESASPCKRWLEEEE